MKNYKGQSLFEVVVALAISSLVIVALVSLVSNSIRNATFSKNKSLASTYAQEASEWLRGQRDSDINNFITKTLTPEWCLNQLNWTKVGVCTDKIAGTNFVRSGSFDTNVINGKNIVTATITVTWTDSQGTHSIENVTDYSDWRER